MTSKQLIWFDDEYWKFKHKTINGYQYQNKDENTRIFVRWQVIQGSAEYEQRWPKNKLKN